MASYPSHDGKSRQVYWKLFFRMTRIEFLKRTHFKATCTRASEAIYCYCMLWYWWAPRQSQRAWRNCLDCVSLIQALLLCNIFMTQRCNSTWLVQHVYGGQRYVYTQVLPGFSELPRQYDNLLTRFQLWNPQKIFPSPIFPETGSYWTHLRCKPINFNNLIRYTLWVGFGTCYKIRW